MRTKQVKKLLAVFIVLGLCCAAKATVVSLKDEGSTITATPGQALVLELVADDSLFMFDAIISVAGDATITDAMDSASAVDYGWFVVFDNFITPIYRENSVEIGAESIPEPGHPGGDIGFVEITYGSGAVIVSVACGNSIPLGFWGQLPPCSTGVVTIVPEPASILLLGLGVVILKRRH